MTKKQIFFLSGLNIVVFLLAGCGSSPKPVSAANTRDLPAFVSNPPSDAYMIFGIGGVKKANARQSIQTADRRALRDITEQLGFIVQGMIAGYSRKAGIEDSQTVLEFQKAVYYRMLNAELRDVHLIKREPAKDGTLYSLLLIKKEDALNYTVDILGSEASRFSEFKDADFFEEMAKHLFETQTKPAIIMN